MTRPRDDSFRVLTWNVHGCIGSAGRFDPDAIVDAVRSLEADIVSLQEIDARDRVAGTLDAFGYIGRRLGWQSFDARTIRTERGDYGHLLSTRWSIDAPRYIDLSIAGFEPRAAIACTVPELDVDVIAAHLGLRARERQRQVEAIVAEVQRLGDRRVVVLGDFNEWRRVGVATRTLCPPFVEAAAAPSFPAWRPFFSLDRIWCSPALEALEARSVKRMAHLSDHLPVIADLRPARAST